VAAEAAFLERATALTPERPRRAQRALAAARAKQLAGAPQTALRLLAIAQTGPLGESDRAGLQHLRGQTALDLRRPGEALPLLLDAARRLESFNAGLARNTHLEALRAASVAGRLGGEMAHAAKAARTAPRPDGQPRAVDLLLDGLAIRFTDGYTASASTLKRALSAVSDEGAHAGQDVRWPWLARRVAPDLFADDAWHYFATRSVQMARERGALAVLPLALNYLAHRRCFEGDLDAAAALLDEADEVAAATGSEPIVFGRLSRAAFRGEEAEAALLFEASEPAAIARGEGVVLTFIEHGRTVLNNGLGEYESALASACSAAGRDELMISVWSLPELIEAATRCGRTELASAALERLSECTRAAGTDLALGIEARSWALLSEAEAAERRYREAIERLGRTRICVELARAHLVYGEWLRRERRRLEARGQLRTAREMFVKMRAEAFARRAERELLATGERARKRTVETRDGLTAQEAQIARLARDGLSNPEIGAQLFISARTVEYHLHKVFTKLNISSRSELDRALPGETDPELDSTPRRVRWATGRRTHPQRPND
jgi:DNA-binding CsgD family transcriptional regulator